MHPTGNVVTVDGFQANEADLTYVLTTRSVEKLDEETERVLEFIQDQRRATVALSRSRQGLVLHGNLNTLAAGDVWRKFINAQNDAQIQNLHSKSGKNRLIAP